MGNKIYRYSLAGLSTLGICMALYVCLSSALLVALIVIALAIVILSVGERKNVIDKVYRLIGDNKALNLGIIALFILLLPFLVQGNNYLLHIAIMAGIFSIVALGLNFQIGGIGQINFAPAAFYGMGAYTSAFLSVKMGLSPWLGTLCGLLMAIVLGVVVGFPALKARGYYLSLVTIALQIIFTLMIVNSPWIGGPNGIPGIPSYQIGGFSFRTPVALGGIQLPYQVNFLYLVYILLALFALAANRLYNSRVGLAWNAIEQDPIVAACQGINLTNTQLLAFCLGAAYAGIAGAIYGHYTSFIGVENFDFSQSLIFICMVILGGTDNVPGVVLGAVLLTMIDEKLRDFSGYRLLMYGIVLIIILIIRPKGLLPKRIRVYQQKDRSEYSSHSAVVTGGSR
ncbi:MAG: hypothetical protein PWQ18_169 [Clostridia bacterium]|nr:hypothetical protein [Clostridia bacterium]